MGLAPEIVNCPAPVLVNVPVDVPITPDSVEVPMDSTVRLYAPLIALDDVSVAPLSI